MPSLEELQWLTWKLKVDDKLSKLSEAIRVKVPSYGSLCLHCKAGRMLCGKSRCPLLVKAEALLRSIKLLPEDRIDGSSPPGVFVGRVGYPKVYVGPLIPPFHGDTTLLDTPESWVGRGLDEIIGFRYSLVRAVSRLPVEAPALGDRNLEKLHELTLSSRPVDAEAEFSEKPRGSILLSDEAQPFGPSAPIKSLNISPATADRQLEKCYYDQDLKAWDAVLQLYENGVPVSRIQKSFSLGMLGEARLRRLVPTRWSITAVDNLISLNLIKQIKSFNPVSEYRVYVFKNLDNIFLALLIPEAWNFEWIEAWFPGTTWNPAGETVELMGDYEGYKGRSSYPEVGGCYFAARLAAVEKLRAERRQAGVLILREIHSGYLLPVGVWNVRESIRQMFRLQPEKFQNLREALDYAMGKLTVPFESWLKISQMLKRLLYQRRLLES